tara:strand:- start:361 stop:573 length:213 start_codon:yes stop_codon:yes gene_type:complete
MTQPRFPAESVGREVRAKTKQRKGMYRFMDLVFMDLVFREIVGSLDGQDSEKMAKADGRTATAVVTTVPW